MLGVWCPQGRAQRDKRNTDLENFENVTRRQQPVRRCFLGRHFRRSVCLRDRSRQPLADGLNLTVRASALTLSIRKTPMFNTDTGSRLIAAAFSVVLSIGTFAYAIVPATPSLA